MDKPYDERECQRQVRDKRTPGAGSPGEGNPGEGSLEEGSPVVPEDTPGEGNPGAGTPEEDNRVEAGTLNRQNVRSKSNILNYPLRDA